MEIVKWSFIKLKSPYTSLHFASVMSERVYFLLLFKWLWQAFAFRCGVAENCACASTSCSFARKCRRWQVALHVNQPLLTARGEWVCVMRCAAGTLVERDAAAIFLREQGHRFTTVQSVWSDWPWLRGKVVLQHKGQWWRDDEIINPQWSQTKQLCSGWQRD